MSEASNIVDVNLFKQSLLGAKDKFSKQDGVVIEIPNAAGEMEKFIVWENSNFEPALQAQFPWQKSRFQSPSCPGRSIRLYWPRQRHGTRT